MKNDKRGVLGLDTVKAVLLILLGIGVLVVVTFLVLSTLQTATENVETKTSKSVVNETIVPNTLGTYLKCGSTSCTLLRNPSCTITLVQNGSNNDYLSSGNWTITTCNLANTTDHFSYKAWNVSYTYSYNTPYANQIVQNTTIGSAGFFSYVPTFFILLAVVVLILIIAIVIVAVSRFGGGEGAFK